MSQPLVLVIEDDPYVGANTTELLEFLDLSVRLVTDGASAHRVITETRPALILTDLHLPGKSGLDILADVRADARLAGTKVVLVTGDSDIDETVVAGADGVLIKPYTIDQLNDLVTRMLEV